MNLSAFMFVGDDGRTVRVIPVCEIVEVSFEPGTAATGERIAIYTRAGGIYHTTQNETMRVHMDDCGIDFVGRVRQMHAGVMAAIEAEERGTQHDAQA